MEECERLKMLDAGIAKKLGLSPYEVPRYSTCGNAMLKLDTEMRRRGWTSWTMQDEANVCCIADYRKWDKNSEQLISIKGRGATETLARALAVYRILTGKEFDLYAPIQDEETEITAKEMIGELADVVHTLIEIMLEIRSMDGLLNECKSSILQIKEKVGWNL